MNLKKRNLTVLLMMLFLFMIASASADTLKTEIDSISKYGNLVLSIPGSQMLADGYSYGDLITVHIDGQDIEMPVGSNYSDVDQDYPICRIIVSDDGSVDQVILAIYMGDLATNLGIAQKETTDADPGYIWHLRQGLSDPVPLTIDMAKQGGYYDQWVIHQLTGSDIRSDYPDLSDEQYANFREITTTGMAKSALYRSSSPFNPIYNRNKESDNACAKAGIKTVINLADSLEEMRGYEGFDETYCSGQDILPLNLNTDFSSDDFKEGLANAVRFISQHDGPYLIHCNLGKDRSGYICAILECLMGATANEITSDYMISYTNYYGITQNDTQYIIIADSIDASLSKSFGIQSIYSANLQDEAARYLLGIGLTQEEIDAASACLSKNWN